MKAYILETELNYLKEFSDCEINEGYIRFWDDRIQDMYSHNFIWISEAHDIDKISDIIKKELHRREEDGKSYFRLNIDPSHKEEAILKVLDALPYRYTLAKSAYYSNTASNWTSIPHMQDVSVKKADTALVKEQGKYVDVSASYTSCTMEFAIRRIKRKFEIYDDDTKQTHLYVCYHKNEPVGNCELHVKGNIAKIDDFDILEMYQRKGYGSQVLRTLMMEAENHNAEIVYLVTDQEDTAKEMYMKNGFSFMGIRYEIMMDL